jgi:hypothetical protein
MSHQVSCRVVYGRRNVSCAIVAAFSFVRGRVPEDLLDVDSAPAVGKGRLVGGGVVGADGGPGTVAGGEGEGVGEKGKEEQGEEEHGEIVCNWWEVGLGHEVGGVE